MLFKTSPAFPLFVRVIGFEAEELTGTLPNARVAALNAIFGAIDVLGATGRTAAEPPHPDVVKPVHASRASRASHFLCFCPW